MRSFQKTQESRVRRSHASKNRKIGQKSRGLYRVLNTPIKTVSRFWKSDKGVHMTILIISLLPLSGYDWRRISVHANALNVHFAHVWPCQYTVQPYTRFSPSLVPPLIWSSFSYLRHTFLFTSLALKIIWPLSFCLRLVQNDLPIIPLVASHEGIRLFSIGTSARFL